MKVLQINIFGNLSTGRIAVDLHRTLVAAGHDGVFAFARNDTAQDIPHIRIGTKWDVVRHVIMTRITDKTGFYSKSATKRLVKTIAEYNPDIIHLHNIHGYYLNIEVLFNYLKSTGIPVVWTLHDCWAYTGHCCYYSMAGCNKWKTQCCHCPQKIAYPSSKLIDNSKWNYKKKKELFSGVNMTLVAVSNWLASEVKKSFLSDYPLEVIYNGIDLDVFKPTKSNFREQYNLKDKKIILGVASTWDIRKGLNDFIELSKILDDQYKIVVVGVTDKEISRLPQNIIGIRRTDSVEELAGLYSTADVYFNASVEETFGLPTVEAMACGTPSIVYNATALPELIESGCGKVVGIHDLTAVKSWIVNFERETSAERCINTAKKYSKEVKYKQYINLYERILKQKRPIS